jgi:hypothetical protein
MLIQQNQGENIEKMYFNRTDNVLTHKRQCRDKTWNILAKEHSRTNPVGAAPNVICVDLTKLRNLGFYEYHNTLSACVDSR